MRVRQHPHLDYGYGVTNQAARTGDRVPIHVDTEQSPELVNNRITYVSVSRAQFEVQMHTNDAKGAGISVELDLAPRDHAQRVLLPPPPIFRWSPTMVRTRPDKPLVYRRREGVPGLGRQSKRDGKSLRVCFRFTEGPAHRPATVFFRGTART